MLLIDQSEQNTVLFHHQPDRVQCNILLAFKHPLYIVDKITQAFPHYGGVSGHMYYNHTTITKDITRVSILHTGTALIIVH